MRKFLLFSFSIAIISAIQSCKSSAPMQSVDDIVLLDTVEINVNPTLEIYRASETRINDLLHTKLEVSFNWDSTFLYGKANLSLTPYFLPTDSLTLDAKGFQIHEVSLVDHIGKRSPLHYDYDGLLIRVQLDKSYTREDSFEVYINYTAMPNKLEAGGSAAITSDKGLYFINPDGSDADKPKQIWTQGETESSSCWFPTIDSPNEKTTQEIYITVDANYKTLSNGNLIFQTENPDGSRTDYWKQDLPHAPYLFMMAVGEFAVVEDQWRDIPVNYYVEPAFERYAKEIFPNSVEMIEFFSNRLGYDYPWDKYHQVVVRDYVSGAMENTGAVIYGDFVQGNHRYLIDNSGEDIVAHELFHHWFGDLVTCESWSNLPLNESFATYGEYLWIEHKYGRDKGDYHLNNDLNVYLRSSRVNKNSLIRFYYETEMDMFDAHSYQKGGRVLHMLREYLGDEVFFAGLQHYLKENEFQAVEIHQLRLAFEKISGQDLNWFFNQWFFGAGHPIITVTQEYNDSLQQLYVTVTQNQKGEDIPTVFELPTDIEIIRANGEKEIKNVVVDEAVEYFSFPMAEQPQLVNFDARKTLLAEIEQDFTEQEANVLYRKGENYLDRVIGIQGLEMSTDSIYLNTMEEGLNDPFWNIRRLTISSIEKLATVRPNKTYLKLKDLAKNDIKSDVRAAALDALILFFSEKVELETLQEATNDSSYIVVSAAIAAIYDKDEAEGIRIANQLESIDDESIQLTIANIYSIEGDEKYNSFFNKNLNTLDSYSKYPLMITYTGYLLQQEDDIILKALPSIEKIGLNEEVWWVRMSAVSSLIEFKTMYEDRLSAFEKLPNQDSPDFQAPESMIEAKKMRKAIVSSLTKLQRLETDQNVLRMIENELK